MVRATAALPHNGRNGIDGRGNGGGILAAAAATTAAMAICSSYGTSGNGNCGPRADETPRPILAHITTVNYWWESAGARWQMNKSAQNSEKATRKARLQ